MPIKFHHHKVETAHLVSATLTAIKILGQPVRRNSHRGSLEMPMGMVRSTISMAAQASVEGTHHLVKIKQMVLEALHSVGGNKVCLNTQKATVQHPYKTGSVVSKVI